MQLSQHAAQGTFGFATFLLMTVMGGKKAVALVDSGSTNSLMDYEFVVRSKCQFNFALARKVSVVGGGELKTDALVESIGYKIQGICFKNSFRLPTLKTYDLILGVVWIYEHNPIMLDLKRHLYINKKGKMVTLKDFTEPKEKCRMNSVKLEKLARKGVMGCMLHAKLVQEYARLENSQIPAEISEVLSQYIDVFQEPCGLPLVRDCDHSIHIKVGAEPPNIRPYRIPHVQKEAMENIIKQLTENNESGIV